MKKGNKILAILMLVVFMTALLPLEGKAKANPLELTTENGSVPEIAAGTTHKLALNLKNVSEEEYKNIKVYPIIADEANWPFITDKQSYSQVISKIVPGEIKDATFSLKAKENIESKRYGILVGVAKDDEELFQQVIYVNGKAKKEEPKEEEKAKEEPEIKEEAPQVEEPSYDSGATFSTGEYVATGEENGNASIPRVIVTGFSTNPGTVNAGGDFVLTVNLKNTSTTTKVANLLFDFEAEGEGSDEQTSGPAFIPTSGSSSVYLKEIGANGTANIKISLHSKADLVNKPYGLSLAMKYEDSSATQIEATSSLSIPVSQKARFELSEFELSPNEVGVGEEANIMCNLYNMGRIKLYNVKAVFEGDTIKKTETFVGNVEPGSTASIDAMLTGKKEGKSEIKMTLTYEDEAGKVEKMEKTLKFSVIKAVEETTTDLAVEKPTSSKGKLLPLLLLVVIIVAVIVIFLKKKKKKNLGNEEEELLDEINGSTKD
ncbi:MAG TPA: hypothetical protein H9887_09255 [Candidatus Dorea intestinavium]|nr:hypothetical protein [Candidatus Dorea intestinavium]